MTPLTAIGYCLLFGLLHGILPDEHTWPITFSYAIGGASGRAGLKAGIYFAAAFTVQRMIIAELAYLALAPFLMNSSVDAIVDIAVGVVMTAAGYYVLFHGRDPHLHFPFGKHEDSAPEPAGAADPPAPPIRWTLVHGFIAGFGFGGFSLFVNLIAVPAMGTPWLGFLPGLVYGLGTTAMLAVVGFLFGGIMRWTGRLSAREIRRIGAKTGGRALFFGGFLFLLYGAALLLGLNEVLSPESSFLLIGSFMIVVAVPAFLQSLRETLAARKAGLTKDPKEKPRYT
jgi:hypothetical protein